MIARGDASHVERFLCECLCLFPKKNERFVLVHSGRRCTNSFMFVFAFCFNVPVLCRLCSLLFITSIGSLGHVHTLLPCRLQTIDNEANRLIIYCLNCIRHGRNATYEPGLTQNTTAARASPNKRFDKQNNSCARCNS